jgi:Protein of unknown function (DUF1360)
VSSELGGADRGLQDLGAYAGHSDRERPLGAYAALTGTFMTGCAAFAWWLRRSGRQLPERIADRDLVLASIATHKASRMIAKDRVSSAIRAPFTRFEGDAGPGEVDEAARGSGLRRAIGELLVCPYCLGMWVSALLVAGLLVAPRATRLVTSLLVVLTGADVLQIAYKKAEDLL